MYEQNDLQSILTQDLMPLLALLAELERELPPAANHGAAAPDPDWDGAIAETRELLELIACQREVLAASLHELEAQRELVAGGPTRNEDAWRALRRQEETLRGLLIACDRILETGRVVSRRLGLPDGATPPDAAGALFDVAP